MILTGAWHRVEREGRASPALADSLTSPPKPSLPLTRTTPGETPFSLPLPQEGRGSPRACPESCLPPLSRGLQKLLSPSEESAHQTSSAPALPVSAFRALQRKRSLEGHVQIESSPGPQSSQLECRGAWTPFPSTLCSETKPRGTLGHGHRHLNTRVQVLS